MPKHNGSIVVEFAKRTLQNLSIIENHNVDPNDRREVTQLINSLLGLVVVPQQKYLDTVPDITPATLLESQWPKAFFHNTVTKKDIGLHESLTKLRHAIAHFNVDIVSKNGVIAAIKFWNHPGGNQDRPIDWSTQMSINDLRDTVQHLSETYHSSTKLSTDNHFSQRPPNHPSKLSWLGTSICFLMLLYPPMQSTSSASTYGDNGGVGIGGRDFSGWGPFWEILHIDWDFINSPLEVGGLLEGGYAIEWSVLFWQFLFVYASLKMFKLVPKILMLDK